MGGRLGVVAGGPRHEAALLPRQLELDRADDRRLLGLLLMLLGLLLLGLGWGTDEVGEHLVDPVALGVEIVEHQAPRGAAVLALGPVERLVVVVEEAEERHDPGGLVLVQERDLVVGGPAVQVGMDKPFELSRHQRCRLAGDGNGDLLVDRRDRTTRSPSLDGRGGRTHAGSGDPATLRTYRTGSAGVRRNPPPDDDRSVAAPTGHSTIRRMRTTDGTVARHGCTRQERDRDRGRLRHR